jgi:hypothetical protein
MPVEFLSDDQAERYGRFADPASRAHLERRFFVGECESLGS